MKCPICGADGLQRDCEREMPYAYRGREAALHLRGNWCAHCGGLVMDDAQAAGAEEQIQAVKQAADSAV